jgi:putative DNA primase/helicase
MLSLAWSENGVPVRSGDFDADPFLLTCANGTVDLGAGALRQHRREDLITKCVPIPFDAGAACPLWLQTLELIFAGNPHLGDFLQRAAGYSLTGDVSAQCLFFVYGTGENGKSTIIDTLLTLAGDYGRQAQPDLLMVHWGEAHPTGLADLCGARFRGERRSGRRPAHR